jgi:hypothetical protein
MLRRREDLVFEVNVLPLHSAQLSASKASSEVQQTPSASHGQAVLRLARATVSSPVVSVFPSAFRPALAGSGGNPIAIEPYNSSGDALAYVLKLAERDDR